MLAAKRRPASCMTFEALQLPQPKYEQKASVVNKHHPIYVDLSCR